MQSADIVTALATGTRSSADPLRALALESRLRCYRDACGDWEIPGRWGEIFWYGAAHDGLPDRIGVQVGGPRANGSQAAVPIGSNKRINGVREIFGKPNQSGAGEAVFILPAERIREAAKIIGARRRRAAGPHLVSVGARTRFHPGVQRALGAPESAIGRPRLR
jgi:hypothetical protein